MLTARRMKARATGMPSWARQMSDDKWASIRKPRWYKSGNVPESPSEVVVHDGEAIAKMRVACQQAAYILDVAAAAVFPGATTASIDSVAFKACIECGVYPSPLNYHGFPASLCTSINDVVCHGIPDATVLSEGDIINVDVSVFTEDGYHGRRLPRCTRLQLASGTVCLVSLNSSFTWPCRRPRRCRRRRR